MFRQEVGPDVPYGWNNRLTAPRSLIVWVWSQPPEIGAKLAKKTYWLRTADSETTTERQQLHRLTLREIQQPDSLSPDVPVALKKLIDTNLARSARGPAEAGKRVTHPGDETSSAGAAWLPEAESELIDFFTPPTSVLPLLVGQTNDAAIGR